MKQNRKQFLQLAGTATAAAMLPTLEGLAEKPTTLGKANDGYALKVFATNWGFEGSIDSFCAKAKRDGYDGIENWWPGTLPAQQDMFEAVKKHDLDLAIVYGAGEGTYAKHALTFKANLDLIAKRPGYKPLYINLHSGKDHFKAEENAALIDYSIALAKETGIPIYHETHRGRMLFAAHTTAEFLKKHPGLKLTLDISHWCNVHESMLEDQKQATDLALQHTEHIHARVGHQQGPQVADPRAPEWAYALEAHLAWWDAVVARKRKQGALITFLAEFGPPHYMQTLPYTQQPLSNQWEINVFMKNLLKKRYG